MELLKKFIASLLAGVAISIGGTVFLACENKIIGSIFFTCGLMTICIYGLNLYTGKIAYVFNNKLSYALDCILIWLGNLAGTLICGISLCLTRESIAQKAQQVCETKLQQGYFETVLLGVFCGILVYVAVDNFKTSKGSLTSKILVLFVCIPLFIIAGFEHSIADMFYFAASEKSMIFTSRGFVYILLVTLGNSLGSIVFHVLKGFCTSTQK